MAKLTIKDWADDDKPREKMQALGRNALSNSELIAIILGSGNVDESAVDLAKRILDSVNGDLNKLGLLELNDFMAFKGIGPARGIEIMAALELGRRHHVSKSVNDPVVTTSVDAFNLFYPLLADLKHEEMWMITLSSAKKVTRKYRISQGGTAETVVDIKLVARMALEQLAGSVIIAHNHPSGSTTPSDKDYAITRKIKFALSSLDITLNDHIIIAGKNYYSFHDNNDI